MPIGKIYLKNHGLPDLHHAHLLEVALTKIPGVHATLSIVRHVGLPVNFAFTKSSVDL
jgi:hypothetical protein